MQRKDFMKLVYGGGSISAIAAVSGMNLPVDAGNKENNLESKFDFASNSVKDLKCIKFDKSSSKTYSLLLGYYEPGDGGGGIFYWDDSCVKKENSGTIIKSDLCEKGRWKRLFSGAINVKWFGAKGDNTVDDQPAIQAAIDEAEGGGKVFIPSGDYTLSLAISGTRPAALHPKQNVHIEMGKDTILRLEDDEEAIAYNFISLRNSKNITIEGGNIIGNKKTSSALKGEHGLGISIVSATNITIKSIELREHWGDGIYIGRYGGEKRYAENVTLNNVICDDNRRQGLSVISVKGLNVDHCEFKNTYGTAPSAGIDFEPNRPDEILQNIVLKDFKVTGNDGSGVLINLSRLAAREESEITMSFEDMYSFNNGEQGFAISGSFNSEGTGQILVKDSIVKNNGNRAAYYIRNWHKNAPPLLFRNIIAINPNLSGGGGTTQGSGLAFYHNKNSFEQGNLHIDGFEVQHDKSGQSKSPENIYVERDLWNCSLRNIRAPYNSIYNAYLLDLEKNNQLSLNDSYNFYSYWPGDSPVVIKAQNVKLRNYHNDPDKDCYLQGENREETLMPFTLASVGNNGNNSFGFRAPKGEIIHPKGIYGRREIVLNPENNNVGARLKIQRIKGKWVVLNIVGKWTSR